MRSLRLVLTPLMAFALLAGSVSFRAQRSLYSQDQISQMVAPIALYPDALMSQVLMAATFPDQVQDADAWVRANPGLSGRQLDDALSTATWDPSIIALCKFPTVLDRMADNIKWTTDLGNAFLNQRADVMSSVQELRRAAYREGRLQTTPQQRVVVEPQAIVIQPAVPDVIYVPAYDPFVVYGPVWSYPVYYYPGVWAPWPGYSFVNGFAWGIGFAFGNILFGGCDWYHHDVWVNNTVIVNSPIYHGCHYYRNGDWNGYGRQPWRHYDGGYAYARGGSGAPYGGRDHGSIRGVPARPLQRPGGGMEQARLQDRRGYTTGPAEHVPMGRVERGSAGTSPHGPSGWTGRTEARPGAQSPTERGRTNFDRPKAHGPSGWVGTPSARGDNPGTRPYGRQERTGPAAHGPSGWTGRPASRPEYQNPRGQANSQAQRPRAQGPSGWEGQAYGRPENRGSADYSRPQVVPRYDRPQANRPAMTAPRSYPGPSSAPSFRAPSGSRPSAPAFGGRGGGGGRVAVPRAGGGHPGPHR
jgi:hypothetical protein